MSILLFTSQIKYSDKQLIGCFIGSLNYANIRACNLESELTEGLKAFEKMNSFTTDSPAFALSSSRLIRRNFKDSEFMIKGLYDHFFAKKWHAHHKESYYQHISDVYEKLSIYHDVLPYTIKKILPEIIDKQIISNLHTVEGYYKYINHMVEISKISSMVNVNLTDFHEKYHLLTQDFDLLYENFIQNNWLQKSATATYQLKQAS